MVNKVLLLDTSGSMWLYWTNLSFIVKNMYLPMMVGSSDNVAIVSFNEQVFIKSKYTRDLASLQTIVDGLSPWGGTAFNDAMLVALVFENPCPDEIHVWSDYGDNSSCSDGKNYKEKVDEMDVDLILNQPEEWMKSTSVQNYGPITLYPLLPAAERFVAVESALVKAKEIAKRVKKAKVIEKPEDLLKLRRVEKK
ncbi:MAG: VWA domain-containing protein [Candidatus Helarchaeota archaeon]|nr:VWA domain-containing protein [Candidatus Helarchaeota archaeon]